MKLIRVRKFNGLVLYGYTDEIIKLHWSMENFNVYWSMKLYEECYPSPRLVEYIHNYRFTDFHIGIVVG